MVLIQRGFSWYLLYSLVPVPWSCCLKCQCTTELSLCAGFLSQILSHSFVECCERKPGRIHRWYNASVMSYLLVAKAAIPKLASAAQENSRNAFRCQRVSQGTRKLQHWADSASRKTHSNVTAPYSMQIHPGFPSAFSTKLLVEQKAWVWGYHCTCPWPQAWGQVYWLNVFI